jgi:hypothetical protein
MDIIATDFAKIQNLTPGQYAACYDEYLVVAEYPVITGQGVFVNFRNGDQLGPLPLDTMIEVPVFE